MKPAKQALLLCSAVYGLISASSISDSPQHPLVHRPDTEAAATTTTTTPSNDGDAPPYRVPLLSLHRALVDVPSISGSEGAAALLLEKVLTDLNYTVELQRLPSPSSDNNPDSRERYNVLAWPGRDADRTLDDRVLVTSHIDVVPPYIPYAINHTAIPPHVPYNFTSIPATTLLSGRGTVDAKASLAAQIVATTALLAAGSIPRSAVVLLFVVGEETSGDGMKHFSASLANYTDRHPNHPDHDDPGSPRRPRLRAAVFGEPTENRLACGHKGILGATVRARGRAGHSGYPGTGKSATAALVRGLAALLDADLGASARFGRTTVNVGVLAGGVAANVIAEEASARVAVRVAVGNRTAGARVVEGRMRAVLREADAEALELEVRGGYGPVECDCDVEGFETMVANYGTDVPNLEGEQVNYLYGPGSILVAHGEDEGLLVRDLEEAVEGYKRLITHAVNASS
ncbi:4925f1c0-cb9a-4876-8a09-9b045c0040f1 [Thermothielavioides terrestris]|uniref:4925f1c0-cb9a-4876-8a09-9b045c0040f1 n=1 Tax=Thermothielavioides terrestris TaxID=2587410 RepID=A0A446BQY0_9PEZI|nr:4925f1c0-cb9a-4876-8a09-9b045c0040f1 [Thermothielavioides terrestris]